MGYQFVTSCAICTKRFGVLWVMNPIQVGMKNVATITCPLCGSRFSQDAKELVPVGSEIHNLVVGRPVRSVEIDYECPLVARICIAFAHDLSWNELSIQNVQSGVCDNRFCPKRGLHQELKPSRVLLGSLNPA